MVGDLAGAGRWIPGITDIHVQGMERVCTFAGATATVQHETISNYSAEDMSYDYDIRGGPVPAKTSRGRFAVKAGARGSVITWEHELEPLDPAQEEQIARM